MPNALLLLLLPGPLSSGWSKPHFTSMWVRSLDTSPSGPSHSEIVEFTRNWQKGISLWQLRASASLLPRICQFFWTDTAVHNTTIVALWDEVWCSSPRKCFHFDNLVQFTGISMEIIKAYMRNQLDSLTLLTQSSVCKKALDNASTQTFLTKAHTLVSDMYFIIILLNPYVCILMILLWCSMLIKITQKLLKCSHSHPRWNHKVLCGFIMAGN